MPRISLVVCLYKERDLLERLLGHCEGCYDDLVVVHDGRENKEGEIPKLQPELAIDWGEIPQDELLPPVFSENQSDEKPGSIREFVRLLGGRFYEHPRIGSLEGQSPFAWWAAKYDWILRLDADEFPSVKMQQWLREFRLRPEEELTVPGYTCIWPFFDGKKAATKSIPLGRLFLFNKRRVNYFGMTEQIPMTGSTWGKLPLVLHHEPRRKSFGIRYLVRHWSKWLPVIYTALKGSPLDLPRWQWNHEEWPEPWAGIQKKPIRTALKRLIKGSLYQYYEFKRSGEPVLWDSVIATGIHGSLIPVYYFIRKFCKRKS